MILEKVIIIIGRITMLAKDVSRSFWELSAGYSVHNKYSGEVTILEQKRKGKTSESRFYTSGRVQRKALHGFLIAPTLLL